MVGKGHKEAARNSCTHWPGQGLPPHQEHRVSPSSVCSPLLGYVTAEIGQVLLTPRCPTCWAPGLGRAINSISYLRPPQKDLPQQQLCGPPRYGNLSLMPSWVTWAGWYHAQVHCQHAASMDKHHCTLYSKSTLLFSHIPPPPKRHRLAWSLSGFELKCIPWNARQKADSSLLQIILFHKLFQFDCVHTSVVFTDLKHAGKCVYWRNIPYTGKFQANICGKQFSKLQTQIFIPEEGCYKSSQRTETYHVTSVSSQLEGRPADLWTKNPSERCWERLIKSWCVYGQIKTQRGGRTKFMKQATHCNHLISVPITFGGQGSTLLAWHNSSKVRVKCSVFLSVYLANEQQWYSLRTAFCRLYP